MRSFIHKYSVTIAELQAKNEIKNGTALNVYHGDRRERRLQQACTQEHNRNETATNRMEKASVHTRACNSYNV